MAVAGADDRDVFAVEHQVEVRDSAGVSPEELENAPYGEDVAGLKDAVVAVDVGAAADDGQAEGGVGRCLVEHLRRDAGGGPRAEVFVDPSEVVRASWVGPGRGGGGRGGGGEGDGGGGWSEVRGAGGG